MRNMVIIWELKVQEIKLNINIAEESWTKIWTMQFYKSVVAKSKEMVLKQFKDGICIL